MPPHTTIFAEMLGRRGDSAAAGSEHVTAAAVARSPVRPLFLTVALAAVIFGMAWTAGTGPKGGACAATVQAAAGPPVCDPAVSAAQRRHHGGARPEAATQPLRSRARAREP